MKIYEFLVIVCFGMLIGIGIGVLEQEESYIEQAEEKEVYVNKCKMYEDLMRANGITLDECECR